VQRLSRNFLLSLILVFLLGIFAINFVNVNFKDQQLAKYSLSNPAISKVTVAWPRLISKPNDLDRFNSRLLKSNFWQVDLNFLIFREMSDSRGRNFYLIGSKELKNFFKSAPTKIPTACNQNVCEVLLAYPRGAEIPEVANLGLQIIDSQPINSRLPIPKDFGIASKLPILITPEVDQLSALESFRYLPASYGWQITPKNLNGVSATEYGRQLSKLESNLTSTFPNVAVNFNANMLDRLIGNQERLSNHMKTSLKIIFCIFLIALVFTQRKAISLKLPVLLALSVILLLFLQSLWGFTSLLQILLFATSITIFTLLTLKILDRRLLARDFATLTNFRSSKNSIAALALLFSLFVATLFSSVQYLSRTEEGKKLALDIRVPQDFSFKVGPSLDKPLDLGSLTDLEGLTNGGTVTPVIKNSALLVDDQGVETEVNLLAIGDLWDEPRIDLPLGESISLNANGIAKEIDVILWVRTNSGAHFSLTTSGVTTRSADIPNRYSGNLSIVAIELRENPESAARREHALGESTGRAFDVLSGTGNFSNFRIDGQRLPVGREWPILNFSYALLDGPNIHRPVQTGTFQSVLLSDDFAKSSQKYELSSLTDSPIEITNFSIAEQFPGIEPPFAIVNLSEYQKLVSQSEPGTIDPLEIWIETDSPSSFISQIDASTFTSLKLLSRSELEMKQEKSPYWKSWSLLFFLTLVLISLLILLTAIFNLRYWNVDRRKKSFELTNYFQLNAPSKKPVVAILILAIFASIPALLISRLLVGIYS
jgi:hypothetical protein